MLAGLHTGHLDLGVHAKNGVLEADLEIVADVLAALRAIAPAAAATAAEEIAETSAEEVAENVAEIGESVGVEAAGCALALQAGVAKAVIGGPFLRVAEDAVCLGGFLKLIFRRRIVGVMIGMVLPGEPAVRGLNIRLAGLPAQT